MAITLITTRTSSSLVEEYGDTALERRVYEDIYNPSFEKNQGCQGIMVSQASFANWRNHRKVMTFSA